MGENHYLEIEFYMEYKYDDVKIELVDSINPQHCPVNSVVFYCERRHILEIVPELILSVSLFITCLALILYFGSGCESCLPYVILAVIGAFIFSFIPFVAEYYRWSRDIIILTQFDFKKIYYDVQRITQNAESYGFISDANVSLPLLYRWMGFDVGSLVVSGVQKYTRTPLVPKPFTLLTRLREAENFKPPANTQPEPWRNR